MNNKMLTKLQAAFVNDVGTINNTFVIKSKVGKYYDIKGGTLHI